MRIDVEREAYIGVPQELLDELGVDALPQPDCGASVPQVVKAGLSHLMSNGQNVCRCFPTGRIILGEGPESVVQQDVAVGRLPL